VQHLESQPCQSGGWVSPWGAFYPCEIYQHDALAYRLSLGWYDDSRGARGLEQRGWGKIFANGNCDVPLGQVTSEQVNTLLDVLFVSDNKVFRAHLTDCLKLIFAALDLR